jgi:hypothetical protein
MKPNEKARYVIGVDVGTGSARAGVFDLDGHMLASAKRDITLFRHPGAIVEQSSNEIWDAVCAAVREAVALAAIPADQVAGIGFDATCSLVVLGEGGADVRGRPATPNAISSSGWTIAPSTRPLASMPPATPSSSMWAGASRPRWKRRSCCGSTRTSATRSTGPGNSWT